MSEAGRCVQFPSLCVYVACLGVEVAICKLTFREVCSVCSVWGVIGTLASRALPHRRWRKRAMKKHP
jgi:hypothetical protein